MTNRSKKSSEALSLEELKELDEKAWNDLLNAKTIDESLDALGRGVWIKYRGTKPPEIASPTLADIRAFIEHNESLDRSAMCEASRELSTWLIRKGLPYRKSDNDNEGHEVRVPRALVYSEALICYLLGLVVVDDDGNFLEVRGTQDLKPFSIMAMFSLEKNLSVSDLFQRLIKASLIYKDDGYEGELPPVPIVEAWQNRPRKPKKASVDVVSGGLTAVPYVVSEVSRIRWEAIDGSIDAVIVDGQPLVTHIPDFTTRARGGNLKAYKPQNTQGQLTLGFSFERKPLAQPIPLIAYSEFGGDLHKSIAADVSVLLFLTHASNQPLSLSHKGGARLLARNRQGGFREKINRRDVQRFIDAWVAVSSMMVWIKKNGLSIPYDMAVCSRINDETVTLSKPLWSRRENGQWTLTAGYGAVGKNRLFGKIDDGGIWRTIAGIEYHLARGYPTSRGKNKGIAQPLVAASKGGPTEWQKADWRTFMRLTGDNWDENDKAKDSTVNRRFSRRKEVLKAAGYVTDGRNPATAGDTVEFSFKKKGVVKFRATDRFVEAARLAKEQKWETVNLQNFLNGN